MLPKFLHGTYQQYKQDTKILATWLTVTARGLGYVSKKISVKEPRAAASRTRSRQHNFAITIDDFLTLTNYISTKLTPPLKVPSSIMLMIRRIIEARLKCDGWFGSSDQKDEKDGHIHFIRILQEVYEILLPFSPSSGIDEDDCSDTDEADLRNIFEYLQLEEPSQQFLDTSAPPVRPRKNAQVACDFMDCFVEHMQGYFEESFAASALFADIDKIYQHTKNIWQDYKNNKIDLMTASITSNTAIELIRRLEESFFQQFPRFRKIEEHILRNFKKWDLKHADAQQLVNFMFRARFEKTGRDPWNDDPMGAPFNLDLHKDAQYLFIDMLAIFQTYFTSSQRMSKCVHQPGAYGLWDPDLTYAKLSAADKFQQDRRILLELFPDMALLSTTQSGIPALAEDELLRGSRNFFAAPGKIPKIHLWMLVSMRLFCDIHHTLGRDVGEPFKKIQKMGRDTISLIKRNMMERDRQGKFSWPSGSDESIKMNLLDRVQQSLFTDEVKEYIDVAAKKVKNWPGKKDHELLRRHPWVCGLMEFNIHVGLAEVGIVALSATASGLTAAHLYNALQNEGVLRSPWPDMELFIELIGTDALFRGSRPVNQDEYYSRLALLRGTSVETFARNRRDRGVIISKSVGRYERLVAKSRLLSILKLRYVLVVGHRDTNDEEGTQILAHLEDALNKQMQLITTPDQVIVRTRANAKENHRKKRAPQQLRKYSPVELLMALQFALARELPSLRFDYLAFHFSCCEVLSSLPQLPDEVSAHVSRSLREDPATSIHNYLNLTGAVDFLFILGLPVEKAQQMIRKVAMPVLPPVTSRYQQIFDRDAVFAAVGHAIENKMRNGVLKVLTSFRARKLIADRPDMIQFDVTKAGENSGKVTFKKQCLLQHTDNNCTKEVCVCAAKPVPIFKPGWEHVLRDSLMTWLNEATKSESGQ